MLHRLRASYLLKPRLLLAPLVAISVIAASIVLPGTLAQAEPRLPTLPFGAPHVTVNVNKPGAPGYVFYTTGIAAALPLPISVPGITTTNDAAVIADKSGRVVWRYVPPAGDTVANFRTQMFNGRKVLTWWQGAGANGHGSGVDYIADTRGHVIKTLTPGNGLASDVHEFRLTPDGRALITSYVPVTADLTSVGGPKNGTMLNCVASVVDANSGRVLTHWSAMDHIPVTDTSMRYTGLPGLATFDPFHMNSIALDPSGNLLISFRNLNALYNIDAVSGAVNWRLGGKRSTIRVAPGADFFGQHDAEYANPTTIRLFDNNINVSNQLGNSSIKWIHIDPTHSAATLVRSQRHPAGLATAAMGNAQALPNGNTFGGWGTSPHISEFSPSGELIYDATLPVGTYRAYLDTLP